MPETKIFYHSLTEISTPLKKNIRFPPKLLLYIMPEHRNCVKVQKAGNLRKDNQEQKKRLLLQPEKNSG